MMRWIPFFLAASLFASNCCPPGALNAPSCSCKQYQGVEGKLFGATPCIENPCDPCEIFFTSELSLLAWQGIVGGLEFVLENEPLSQTSNINVNGKLIAPDFSWQPAVKFDLGMTFANRAWDVQFRWTYFHSNSSRTVQTTVNANQSGLLPLWAFPNNDMGVQFLFGRAKAAHDLNFNGFDIEMGYHPFLTPALSLRFITGLKVAQINQKYHLHYSDGATNGTTQLVNATTTLTNQTIGTGPRLGFLSEWHMGKGFSLLGSIAGSLPLWHIRVTRADLDENIVASVPQTIDSFFRNRFWIFRPILETALGFGWNTCLGCREQYPFGINAEYEFQYYSEQNMMSMIVNPGMLSRSFMPRGDLMLHGATLTFHFGF